MSVLQESDAKAAAEFISRADYLLIGAGAGMSADSGLGTFAAFALDDVYCRLGLTYDQISSLDMLSKAPRLFYGFFFSQMRAYAAATPHSGYSVLKRWRDAKAAECTFVVTSNVDGAFAKAGFAPEEVCEIHGNVQRWQCGGIPSAPATGKAKTSFVRWQSPPCTTELFAPPPEEQRATDPATKEASAESLPLCPRCGGMLRPNVFLFGDGSRFVEAPSSKSFAPWAARVLADLRANPEKRLAVVEVGCGLRVPSIRKRCEEIVASVNDATRAKLVRINPDYPSNPVVRAPDFSFQANAATALVQIDRRIKG